MTNHSRSTSHASPVYRPVLVRVGRSFAAPALASALVACGTAPVDSVAEARQAVTTAPATSSELFQLDDALTPGAALLDEDAFVLSKQEWYAVQSYVKSSLALPTTEESMRQTFQLDADAPFTDFAPLRTRFVAIHDHAFDWETKLYPETVDLAGDLIAYADTASYLYEPLQEVIDVLKNRRSTADQKAQAREDMVGILAYLGDEADYYAGRAEAVEDGLHRFGGLLQEDAYDVSRVGGALKTQNGDNGGALSQKRKEIDDLRAELQAAKSQYETMALVAKTSPLYLLIPFYGLFIAPTVAGATGAEAVRLLNRVHELEESIRTLGIEEQRLLRLIQTLDLAEQNANDIATDLDKVIPLVGKLRAHWQLMRGNLDQIVKIIEEDISDEVPVVMNVNLKRALDKWTAVGVAAEAYVKNAYIQVQH